MVRIGNIYKKLKKLNLLKYNKEIENFMTYYENPYSQKTQPTRWVKFKLTEIKNSIKPFIIYDRKNKRWIVNIDKKTTITDCWSRKETIKLWKQIQNELKILNEIYKKYL